MKCNLLHQHIVEITSPAGKVTIDVNASVAAGLIDPKLLPADDMPAQDEIVSIVITTITEASGACGFMNPNGNYVYVALLGEFPTYFEHRYR